MQWPNIVLSLGTVEPLEEMAHGSVHMPDLLRCSTGPGKVAEGVVQEQFWWGSELGGDREEAGGWVSEAKVHAKSYPWFFSPPGPFLDICQWNSWCGSKETYRWSGGLPGVFDLPLTGCLNTHTHQRCSMPLLQHGMRWWGIALGFQETLKATTLGLVKSWKLGCHLRMWLSQAGKTKLHHCLYRLRKAKPVDLLCFIPLTRPPSGK